MDSSKPLSTFSWSVFHASSPWFARATVMNAFRRSYIGDETMMSILSEDLVSMNSELEQQLAVQR